MLVKIRPVIRGKRCRRHLKIVVLCYVRSKPPVRERFLNVVLRAADEESPASGVRDVRRISLKLQGGMPEDGLQKSVQPPGNPRCVNLELDDEDSVCLQQLLGSLQSFERVNVIIYSDVREMGASGM